MRRRVMIARDPDPIEFIDQPAQPLAVGEQQRRGAFVPVEAVSQGKDALCACDHNIAFEPLEGHRGIIGREQLPRARVAREFFEVKIGDEQGLGIRPIQRTRGQRSKAFARKPDHPVCLDAASGLSLSQLLSPVRRNIRADRLCDQILGGLAQNRFARFAEDRFLADVEQYRYRKRRDSVQSLVPDMAADAL